MLQDECIFSKTVLNQFSFDTLEHIEKITYNVLFFDISCRARLVLTYDHASSRIDTLALSASESIELDLLQVVQLFLFGRFDYRVGTLNTRHFNIAC